MSTYTPIASQTLGSAAASVTFSSIPQGYTDLVLVVNAICASGGTDLINLQYNGDTSSGLYSSTRLVGNGSTTNSDRQTSANFIYAGLINSTVRNSDIYQIQNYSNTTTFKTCLARAGVADNQTRATVGLWRNTNAITSLTLSHASSINFASGSTFTIYGIQVGDKAQKAQGGNIVTSDGTYVYHTFTSSGAFIPSQALTVDYLVVAGGGGGGCNSNYDQGVGGGGGGGYRTSIGGTALSVTAKSYPVIVGAGGLGSTNTYSNGSNGNDSTFATITSTGGGGGGSRNGASTALAGSNGGSGGGGAGPSAAAGSGNTPSTSPSQGSNGGAAGSHSGGGGGGASATGSAGSGATGGAGGAGTANSISGTSVTYAGGGGGGGGQSSGTGGAGGAGGGAAGGNTSTTGSNAVVNLGGGGGGGGANSGNYYGGNGGSGIVIIRYLA